MISSAPTPTTVHRTRTGRTRVAGLLAVGAAISAGLGGLPRTSASSVVAAGASSASVGSPASSSSVASPAPSPGSSGSPPSSASSTPTGPPPSPESPSTRASPGVPPSLPALASGDRRARSRTALGGGPLGAADGAIPAGTTVFDDEVPGVAGLDPALLDALRRAATAAAADGVELGVTSGRRSPAYQQRLLREATATYGSAAEAARWVATPETSAHVAGDAVDVGPARAAAWLAEHGAARGLCRIYGNEPWHFELRPEAAGRGCPPAYADPTHDPRMHR